MEDARIRSGTLSRRASAMRLFTSMGMLFLASGVSPWLSPARAQENLIWHGRAEGGRASLSYGIPNSDYAPLSFSCTNDGKGVTFTYAHEPNQPREGIKVEVLLQAADIAVPITTFGFRLELDEEFLLQGRTHLDDRLVDLLTSGETLMVFVEDGSEEYPLDGARAAAMHLIERCKR